jgi:uncharacterized membrane protein
LIPGKFALVIGYPLIPWIGVMAAGYAFGAIMKLPPQRRQRIVLSIGVCATLAFLILRGANLYGNPPYTSQGSFIAAADANGPWHVQKTVALTVISFLDVQKYPPSLQFLLMTLGPSLMLLARLDRRTVAGRVGRVSGFFLVYGRVPLMFYVLHIYWIHAMAVVVTWLWRQPVWWLLHGATFSNRKPAEYGHGLAFVYLMWITVVLALYVPCRWYAGVKGRRKDWWLSYL